jgi:hypothetical protein
LFDDGRRLLVCSSLEELGPALRPRVILASTPELSWPCAALDLLQRWFAAAGAASGVHPARNLLLFTQRALQPGSVAHQLQTAALAMAQQQGAAAPNAPRIYHVNYEVRVCCILIDLSISGAFEICCAELCSPNSMCH